MSFYFDILALRVYQKCRVSKPYKIYNFIRFDLSRKSHCIDRYNLPKVLNYQIYLSSPKSNKISKILPLTLQRVIFEYFYLSLILKVI